MLPLFLMATVTFFYTLEAGTSYQACYQKVGAASPTCQPMTTAPFAIPGLVDDADYDFWVKADGVDSAKVRVHTKKKDVVPPAIVLS